MNEEFKCTLNSCSKFSLLHAYVLYPEQEGTMEKNQRKNFLKQKVAETCEALRVSKNFKESRINAFLSRQRYRYRNFGWYFDFEYQLRMEIEHQKELEYQNSQKALEKSTPEFNWLLYKVSGDNSSYLTYEGGKSSKNTNVEDLEHLAYTCMLWEDTFYVDGKTIAEQIYRSVLETPVEKTMEIALKAKFDMKLRSCPLWIIVALTAKLVGIKDKQGFNADYIAQFLTRGDDPINLIELYRKYNPKKPLPNIYKKAIAKAVAQFDDYVLGKYAHKSGNLKLVDVVNMCHPQPTESLDKLMTGTLPVPNTWETVITNTHSDEEKASAWSKLVCSGELPDMAFLMNIRNIDQYVPNGAELITQRIKQIKSKKILPITFLRAGFAVPRFQTFLETKFIEQFVSNEKLDGKTIVLVDVSGSMDGEALKYASSLAMIAKEKYQTCQVYTFSENLVKVKDSRGFNLAENIDRSQIHGGTRMWRSIQQLLRLEESDRLIVITDEQSQDSIKENIKIPSKGFYIINVASYDKSVDTGNNKITKINGVSEKVYDYIDHIEHKIA